MSAFRFGVAAAFAAVIAGPSAWAAGCNDLLPAAKLRPISSRSITPEDLVQLRDIGPAGNGNPRAGIFTLSPDGTKVAFQIRRGEPDSNSYCFGMYVMPVAVDAQPIRIDSGGEFIKVTFSALGYAVSTPPGIPVDVTPRWSPDGEWIAYLRRDQGVTQVWRAAADGSGAFPVSHAEFDIEDFKWAPGGQGLVVTGRPGLSEAAAALKREGASGYLYDERFMPASSNRPYIREPIVRKAFYLSLTGQLSEISGEDLVKLEGSITLLPDDAVQLASGTGGQAAWLQKSTRPDAKSEYELHIRSVSGKDTVCQSVACDGAQNVWWLPEGEVIIQSSPTGAGLVSFYRWQVGRRQPVAILSTEDLYMGCQRVQLRLVCAQESFTQPRRLIRLDLSNGSILPLFDPNPEFAGFKFGQVKRLHWTNALGIAAYGDLVLPPDHQPGQKHPLIIVQYGSRGFLRGGTGDDFPIHVFAAHGIAVLSMSRPVDYGTFMKGKTLDDEDRLGQMNWADRKSVQSAMDEGIKAADALGVIDTAHLGVTGLSDGASTVQFAMINSHLFKAAAMSNCCVEQLRISALLGPLISDRYMRRLSYPKLTEDGSKFWSPMSLRQNASKIDTPLLLQLPDDEYAGALESYEALREEHKPVEMYVYPDENHVKWQPAHRLASYVRSVDWFDFWLRDAIDTDPRKTEQYRRWTAMKQGTLATAAAAEP